MKRLALLFLSFVLFFALMLYSTSVWAEDSNLWKKGYYTDEFNEATGEEFAFIDLKGTFSNTATTDSDLSVRIIADYNDIQFYLLEYETYKLTSFFDTQTYTIRVKDGADNIHTFSGWLSESTNRIILDDKYKAEMLDILKVGGRIRFAITDDHSTSTKYVFAINNANNFESQWDSITAHNFEYVNGMTNGFSLVRKSQDQVGYIYSSGKFLHNGWDDCSSFSDGMASVKKNGKIGFIDTTGTLVVDYKYDYVKPYTEGYAIVFTGSLTQNGWPDIGKYEVIDKQGNIAFEHNWDAISSYKNGFAAVQKNNKWGFIDINGNILCDPQWSNVSSFSEGYAGVLKNGKWGFIDITGTLIIPYSLKTINDYIAPSFHNGRAIVVINGKEQYIDVNGTPVLGNWDAVNPFNSGYAVVKKNGREQIIDPDGNIIYSNNNNYDLDQVYDGMIKYRLNSTIVEYGFMDLQGNSVIDPIYKHAHFQEGIFALIKDNILIMKDKNGNTIF